MLKMLNTPFKEFYVVFFLEHSDKHFSYKFIRYRNALQIFFISEGEISLETGCNSGSLL